MWMFSRPLVAVSFGAMLALAQQPAPAPEAEFTIPPGTKVPLSLINTVSTKHSEKGDRVYLETAFPVVTAGKIVIPVGSYVAGTITQIKKPGRVKGRGELYVRFDSIMLPNGVIREFRARVGGVDGQASGQLDKSEGMVKSEGNKAGDAKVIGEAAGAGASVGVIASRTAMGAGIGAAAGAAAGIIGVLATRGPDAVLPRGSTVEMVLDRPLKFAESELNFANAPAHPPLPAPATEPAKNVLPAKLPR
jgi:type IV secretion system protein VirB10